MSWWRRFELTMGRTSHNIPRCLFRYTLRQHTYPLSRSYWHSPMTPAPWHPSSWREKPIAQVSCPVAWINSLVYAEHLSQDVVYEDKAQLDTVLNKLRRLPPLVSPVEVSVLGNCYSKDLYYSCWLSWWLEWLRSIGFVLNSLMWRLAKRSYFKAETVLSFLTTALKWAFLPFCYLVLMAGLAFWLGLTDEFFPSFRTPSSTSCPSSC